LKKQNLPFIVLEVTSSCNLNCRYCYNIWKRPEEKSIHLNSYKKAMDTLKKLFSVAEVTQVTMSGGEPFLCERFSEIVLFCRMKKKNVTIISNGTSVSRDEYKQVIDLGVDLFEFPMHSSKPEIHDYLARVEGSWAKVVNSIKTVKELGAKVVCVIVITKVNYKDIKDTLLFIKELGINRVMLNRFNIGGNGIAEEVNLAISHDELRKAYKIANEIAKSDGMTLTSNVCTPMCIVDPKDYPNIRMSSCAANVINMPLTLDIDGNLRLCNHSPVVVGNIFKDKIEDLLHSDYAKSWKEIVPEYCKNCNKYPKCLGGCRAASEQLGLPLSEVDPIVKKWVK